MNHPDIRSFHEDWRAPRFAQLLDRPHFLGRSALDLRWKKNKFRMNSNVICSAPSDIPNNITPMREC